MQIKQWDFHLKNTFGFYVLVIFKCKNFSQDTIHKFDLKSQNQTRTQISYSACVYAVIANPLTK